MTTYNILNTRGISVATLNVGQTSQNDFPIELIGEGFSMWGQKFDQNFYRMLENFSNTTAPTNPVEGQDWYNFGTKVPSFYRGNAWVPYATGINSLNTGLPMAVAAGTVNLAAAGQTTIFQAPGDGSSYYLTGLLMIPVTVNAVTSPAIFNLFKTSSEDIMENVMINNPTITKHAYYPIEGMTETVSGTDQVRLEVATPATATQLVYDVRLFGMIKF